MLFTISVLFFLKFLNLFIVFANHTLEDDLKHHYESLKKKNYHGYSVVRIQPKTRDHYQLLNNLSNAKEFDFWSRRWLKTNEGAFADVMIPPEKTEYFDNLTRTHSLVTETLIENLGGRIIAEALQLRSVDVLAEQRGLKNLYSYQRYASILDCLQRLANENPTLVTLQSIGKSTEGRILQLILIARGPPKPIIFIEAGIHAREWVSPATALYIINDLVNNHQNKPVTQSLLDQFEFHILPLANPDGYEYSHTSDRMWRKTRSKVSPSCFGVDPNRNFAFHWDEIGTSDDPCVEDFAGPKPFSEPETSAIADYLNKHSSRTMAYLTLHSYGELILYPWGWTKNVTRNDRSLNEKARIAAEAVRQVHGTNYTIGTSTMGLYPAAGGSDDYAYAVSNITYSYTIELRDDGKHGFLLPATLIKPTAEEIWLGIEAMVAAIGRDLKTNA